MIVNLPTPPRPTGDNDRDIKALNEWTVVFYRRIVNILRNLDGFNITSIPTNKLDGTIPSSMLTGTIPEELLPVTETAETSTN